MAPHGPLRPLRLIGRALLLIPTLLVLLAATAAAWLLFAAAGLQWAAGKVAWLSNDAVRIEGAAGRLAGPLTLTRIDIAAGGGRYSAHDVRLAWQPQALLDGVLAIDELHIGRIELAAAAAAPAQTPTDLRLPLAVRVATLQIGRIDLRDNGAARTLARDLRAVLASDGNVHRIEALAVRLGAGELTAQATLGAAAPFALAGAAELAVAGPPALRVRARAAGTLDAVALDLDGLGKDFAITGRARVQPFAAQPLAGLRLSTHGLDPRVFAAAAPRADLTLEVDLARNPAGALAGRLQAANGAPAALDRGGLPFSRAAAQLTVDWDAVPRRLTVHALTLTLGRGELAGGGELLLDATRAWRFAGRLRHVDPAAVVTTLPPADLNATVDTESALAPRLAGKLRFALDASRYAGQALFGNGDLAFAGRDAAHMPDDLLAASGAAQVRGTLALQLGASRLSMQGGWGSPAERLRLSLVAPDLAQHRRLLAELAGSLDLTAEVGGFPTRPQFVVDLHGSQLVLPGVRAARLTAAGSLQGETLALRLTAERLRRTDGQELARAEVTLAGTRAQHRLQATATLPGGRSVALAAAGTLIGSTQDWRDSAWRGTLESFSLAGDLPLALVAPAALAASRREVVLGASALALAGGRVELAQTTWTPLRWASSGRFSGVALQLNGAADQRAAPARADGDWTLTGQSDGSLAGRLRARVPDLAGLGPAIDGNFRSAGALAADIELSGSVAAPRLRGAVRGSGLALGLVDQNLRLSEGALAIRFDGARAVVERLDFVARHDPPARAARTAGFAAPAEPGRLAVTGELDLQQRQAHLDATLSRVPLAQQPDLWLVASGTAQLDYRDAGLDVAAGLTADAGFVAAAPPGRPRLADDIVVLGRAPKTRAGPRVTGDIALDLGEHFHVRAAGLAARLSGQLRLRGGGAGPLAASGSIATRDGTFEAYGQRLTVERGIVNFQGALDDPGLNVLALRKGAAVEAGVAVSGTLRHPQVRLVSTPPLPDAEILSWVVLGRAPDAAGTDASLLLAAAGSLLGGEGAGEDLARAFGVDEFALRPAAEGDTLAGQMLTVGKRLSARTTLAYEQGLAAATGTLKLTHALTPRISLVTRAGADNALDLFYSISFD